ncbi:MAG: hypothetical protein AAGA57_08380 [Planctomycetota bacterium]
MTHPAAPRAIPRRAYARSNAALVAALALGAAHAGHAYAAPGDILINETFDTSPFAEDGASPPTWLSVKESPTLFSEWTPDPGFDGQPGSIIARGGIVQNIEPIVFDPNAYYRVSVEAAGETPADEIGINFRWNFQNSSAWGVYTAVTPGHASAFADAQGNASVRIVSRNVFGFRADNVIVEEITALDAAAWGQEVRQALPVTPQVTPYVNAGDTIGATLAKLQNGETVRVVMLGDSIVNDLAHSTWAAQVSSFYPGTIEVIPSIRNGTGMQFYQGLVESEDEGLGAVGTPRLQATVLDYNPDLVLLGGVSHGFDVSAYASVVDQLQAASNTDILIATEAGGYDFGQTEYLQPDWDPALNPAGERFEDEQLALALAEGVGFVDVRGTWGQALNDAQDLGLDEAFFMRDSVHMNHFGQELTATALVEFFLNGQPMPDFDTLLPPGTDLLDPVVLLEEPPGYADPYTPPFADANADGVVDLIDFDALAANYGQNTANGAAGGDFDLDGVVGLLDFNALAATFGQTQAAGVPEPASLAVLAAATSLLARSRRPD